MTWNPNDNHPVKGSIISVDPIRKLKDIDRIKEKLKDKPRDLCLFTIGINSNLRASDLRELTAGQVRGKEAGDTVVIREKKTKKKRNLVINNTMKSAITGLLASRKFDDDDYLFEGQRGQLTVSSINRLVKDWCASIRLKGNYGSHTMRKTWGFHQHKTFGVELPELMVAFNHSSQKTTLSYIGLQSATIKKIFQNEL